VLTVYPSNRPTAYPSTRPTAQSGRWRLEDRTLVSDFSIITAVAASPFTVYAATTHGLLIYDRRTQRWSLPVTSLDGYPTDRVRTALADPVEDAVWLGTTSGWARYDANSRRWDTGIVPGGVSDMMLDARDPASGIFVKSLDGWGFVPRGGLIPEPGHAVPPPGRQLGALSPDQALAKAPIADAMRALILTDPRLRNYHYTSAALSPDKTDLYFGTDGFGLLRVDPITGQWTNLEFGLLAPRAGAVAAGRGGVFVATNAGVGTRRGVTWLADDLTQSRRLEGGVTPGMDFFQGRRMLIAGDALWLATDQGLWKVDPNGGRNRRFNAMDGLPSDNILALAPAPDGVWVGTDRGLAVIAAGDKVVRIGSFAGAVLSLLAVRETLWVGSTVGIGMLPPGASEPGVPPEIASQPSLKTAIVALARVRDTIVLATNDHLAWRDPATGQWTVVSGRGDLGPVTAMAGADDGVWIAGSSGVAFWDPARGHFQVLHVPYDVPAAARDLALDPRYLWIATDSGVVRFDRDAARR
jgi:ligand-binding sensor domain-containing protein